MTEVGAAEAAANVAEPPLNQVSRRGDIVSPSFCKLEKDREHRLGGAFKRISSLCSEAFGEAEKRAESVCLIKGT